MARCGPKKPIIEEHDRTLVMELKSFGLTNKEIAGIMKISHDTLERNYKHELEIAAGEANSRVARSLFQKAVYDNDTTAQIFWLKTRARWREKDDSDSSKATEKLLEEVKALRADLVEKNKRDY